jgi:hypothetical protein
MEMQEQDLMSLASCGDFCEQWAEFKAFCGLEVHGSFWGNCVHLFASNLDEAKYIWKYKRKKLTHAALIWQRELIKIYWSLSPGDKPIRINLFDLGDHSNPMTNLPLITVPTVEIGALTLNRKLLNKVAWMLENPEPKTGVVRLHDEAQVIMSASSTALLTTTTLKEAVTRKRSEFWHPLDLLQFRIRTGEFVRDLKQGNKRPEETVEEVQWRCVSRSGSWRLFTVRYETFLDDMGVPYQFSNNQGTEQIEAPTDFVFTR